MYKQKAQTETLCLVGIDSMLMYFDVILVDGK